MNKTESQDHPRRRRWLTFGFRSLFAGIFVVAALTAWLGEHIVRSRIEGPIVAQIESVRGLVGYDYQFENGVVRKEKSPPGSKLVRSLFGNNIYGTVHVVLLSHPVEDKDVVNLHKLSELLEVSLTGGDLTDQCIDDLLKIRKLRTLCLVDTSITPEGLRKLSSCKTLEGLVLFGKTWSDAHLRTLPSFSNLKYIQIVRAPITDAGVESIRSCKRECLMTRFLRLHR